MLAGNNIRFTLIYNQKIYKGKNYHLKAGQKTVIKNTHSLARNSGAASPHSIKY